MDEGQHEGRHTEGGLQRRGTRRGRLRRAIGSAALTATLGLVGLPTAAGVQAATSTPVLVDWNTGTGMSGYAGPDWDYDDGTGAGSGTAATTVDSDPATTDESTGVVLIDTELAYAGASGAGTGIVLTSDGEVLTNYHVVEGATSISVTVATTGTTYRAAVVGHSASSDIALLRLDDAAGLATAAVDDDTVTLGDDVTAVGNAGGTGTLTAADGTITDLDSSITTASEGSVASEDLSGLIETDADVVPGDSGGPLLDAEGEVVGINTAASSGTSSSTIDGYAVPVEDALAVVQQIRDGAETSTVQVGAAPFLGVQVSDQAAAYAQPGASYGYGHGAASGSSVAAGAAVAGVVADSPAAGAGLAAGDTITALSSTAVGSATALSAALAEHEVGDRVQVTWTDASGSSHEATVSLAASPTA